MADRLSAGSGYTRRNSTPFGANFVARRRTSGAYRFEIGQSVLVKRNTIALMSVGASNGLTSPPPGDSTRTCVPRLDTCAVMTISHETTKTRKHEMQPTKIFRGFVVSWFRGLVLSCVRGLTSVIRGKISRDKLSETRVCETSTRPRGAA